MSPILAFTLPWLISWSVDYALCFGIERLGMSRVGTWLTKSLVHALFFTPFVFGTRETHGFGILPYIMIVTGLPTGAPIGVKIAFPSTVFVLSFGLYAAPLLLRFADRELSLLEIADSYVLIDWLNRKATIRGKALPPEPGQKAVYILQASLLAHWDYPGEQVPIEEVEKARLIAFATRKLKRRFTVVLN